MLDGAASVSCSRVRSTRTKVSRIASRAASSLRRSVLQRRSTMGPYVLQSCSTQTDIPSYELVFTHDFTDFSLCPITSAVPLKPARTAIQNQAKRGPIFG